MQEGLGTCVWADGSEFRGAWKAGVRHGRGVLSRPDGYSYDGEWADSNPHGTGTCRFEDGSRCLVPGSMRYHLIERFDVTHLT